MFSRTPMRLGSHATDLLGKLRLKDKLLFKVSTSLHVASACLWVQFVTRSMLTCLVPAAPPTAPTQYCLFAQHPATKWWLPPKAPPAWITSGCLAPIDLLSPAQQFGLLTECKRWESFKGIDDSSILGSLRLCKDKSITVGIMGGDTALLKAVYPPHSRSPLLQSAARARDVTTNPDAYCLRPCVQGTYVDPTSNQEFRDCFADVVCAFARVDASGIRITPPVLLLQWHETVGGGLARCNSVAPCTLAFLGVRYSLLRLRDTARFLVRTSPVTVVAAPLTGLLTDKQHPSVKVLSLTQPPQHLRPLLAAHMFGGMHTT